MNKRNQLSPEEIEALKRFVEQYADNIKVVMDALSEYARKIVKVFLESDNHHTIIQHKDKEIKKPNMRAWQQDLAKKRRRLH